MTLHGDRVTCDVPGCAAVVANGTTLPTGWHLMHRGPWFGYRVICPACRARYTDDQLRAMLARQYKGD